MATRKVLIRFDAITDVVAVFFENTAAASYRPSRWDNHVMIERDANDEVVGVEVHGPKAYLTQTWASHLVRRDLPLDLLYELDRWLAQRRATDFMR